MEKETNIYGLIRFASVSRHPCHFTQSYSQNSQTFIAEPNIILAFCNQREALTQGVNLNSI